LKSFNFKKRIKNGPSVDELNLSQSTQWSLGLEDTSPLLFINQQRPKDLGQLRSLTIEYSMTRDKKCALTIRAPKLSYFTWLLRSKHHLSTFPTDRDRKLLVSQQMNWF
jgi:hypothetical protein